MGNPSSRRCAQAALALLSMVTFWFCAAAPVAASTNRTSKTHATSAKSEIIANWEAFFSAKTSLKRRIALIQDGSAFANVIKGQAKSNPLASTTTAKVLSVAIKGDKASVRYTIDLGGKPALPNQKGEAVLQGGTWKVGAQSFCALLSLEGAKAAACKAASRS